MGCYIYAFLSFFIRMQYSKSCLFHFSALMCDGWLKLGKFDISEQFCSSLGERREIVIPGEGLSIQTCKIIHMVSNDSILHFLYFEKWNLRKSVRKKKKTYRYFYSTKQSNRPLTSQHVIMLGGWQTKDLDPAAEC